MSSRHTDAGMSPVSCRIDIGKQNEFPIEHLPVRIGKLAQTIPVETASPGFEQVRNVGAVKALATRDEELGGDHLFGRQDLASDAEDFVLLRTIDPLCSTVRVALPTPVMRSTKYSPRRALASQTGS